METTKFGSQTNTMWFFYGFQVGNMYERWLIWISPTKTRNSTWFNQHCGGVAGEKDHSRREDTGHPLELCTFWLVSCLVVRSFSLRSFRRSARVKIELRLWIDGSRWGVLCYSNLFDRIGWTFPSCDNLQLLSDFQGVETTKPITHLVYGFHLGWLSRGPAFRAIRMARVRPPIGM
jgi:hypothetical protein